MCKIRQINRKEENDESTKNPLNNHHKCNLYFKLPVQGEKYNGC